MSAIEGESQRGLITADESAESTPSKKLTQRFKAVASTAVTSVRRAKDGITVMPPDEGEPANPEDEPEVPKDVARRAALRNVILRVVALVVVLVLLSLAAKFLGIVAYVRSGGLQSDMVGAGNAGLALFFVIYAVCVVAHVPGLVFVVAAVLAYGPIKGAGVAFLGGIPAVALTFLIVRAVGGRALGHIKHPYMRRVLRHLDEKPIRSVALLRLVFIMAPGVNYGLALTRVRFRDYVLGSALGLAIPIGVAAWIVDALWG